MTAKYAIGVDYGTQSGRVLLVNVQTGEELAVCVNPYKSGVIDNVLPSGTVLGHDWALQHPDDYLEVLYQMIPKVMQSVQVKPEDVIGIGIDFTSCTMMPLNEDMEPLCLDLKWRDNPHSWVKLWKHHAAQSEADEITELAEKRGEAFLSRYGGKISSEWMLPKILQILRESPDVFEATDVFFEACDWLTYKLTGNISRSSSTSGYKSFWHKEDGYPDKDFFSELDPRLENILDTKMGGPIVPVGNRAGELTEAMAKRIGLLPGTSVAVGIIDAHASVPAVGAVREGQLVMAMGTSTCHMLLSHKETKVEGVCGVVEDGMIPGTFGYEAGQAAVGDIFAWFVEHGIPEYVKFQADQENVGIHEWLEKNASAYKPGQTGLLALDWWNGNRSVLVDADLSGLILGYTLATKPEEIYRALLEATAFGTRKIIDSFLESGLEVKEIFACGGLPQRNRLLMQIYADVTNREIKVAESSQDPALGAAMFGAVAAGKDKGGYDNIIEAAEKMARVKEEFFVPIQEHVDKYNKLYKHYLKLHDYFGYGENDVMVELKNLKNSM
ncbi:ribulokinase [Peribacillus glennii]|uniref:Ribulokinase n=1 Tax=Peribacillus glennii TaxID=2303991 RepID=A0A372LDT6_9BACI|nr:ribulokinase [Peribacillus glennii]RFU63868.1 ribulokinase [Peribacillus glennii]